jgi:hypothetical protein
MADALSAASEQIHVAQAARFQFTRPKLSDKMKRPGRGVHACLKAGLTTTTETRPWSRLAAAYHTPAQNTGASQLADLPLRIPYGNKEVALKLGARYHSGGWYAPPGVDLSAFGERGWL